MWLRALCMYATLEGCYQASNNGAEKFCKQAQRRGLLQVAQEAITPIRDPIGSIRSFFIFVCDVYYGNAAGTSSMCQTRSCRSCPQLSRHRRRKTTRTGRQKRSRVELAGQQGSLETSLERSYYSHQTSRFHTTCFEAPLSWYFDNHKSDKLYTRHLVQLIPERLRK